MPHDEAHSHHHHHHQHAGADETLRRAALITIAFAFVEAAGGWWTRSLALLSDAGHMFTDGGALVLGAVSAWMARRAPAHRHSYGFGPAEVLASLLNDTALLALPVAIPPAL